MGVAPRERSRERCPRDLRRLKYKEGILEGLASTRETELAVCIQPEREDLTRGEPHLMNQAIRAHQRSSEVLIGHQRSSEVIRGHLRSSEVIRGEPHQSVVIPTGDLGDVRAQPESP